MYRKERADTIFISFVMIQSLNLHVRSQTLLPRHINVTMFDFMEIQTLLRM